MGSLLQVRTNQRHILLPLRKNDWTLTDYPKAVMVPSTIHLVLSSTGSRVSSVGIIINFFSYLSLVLDFVGYDYCSLFLPIMAGLLTIFYMGLTLLSTWNGEVCAEIIAGPNLSPGLQDMLKQAQKGRYILIPRV